MSLRYTQCEPVAIAKLASYRTDKIRFETPAYREGKFSTMQESATDTCQQLCQAEAGMAYAVTRRALRDEFGNDIANVPRPDCPHFMAFDELTDNYLICRLPDGCDETTAEQEIAKFHAVFGAHIPGVVHIHLGSE